jgi:hypothetical protein
LFQSQLTRGAGETFEKEEIKMGELTISKRKILTIKKQIEGKTYKQYLLTIPKEFVEQHATDTVFCVANSIWIGVPNHETLLKIIRHIPEIETLLKNPKTERVDEGPCTQVANP